MKKIICTVLSLIIALSMVACGDTAPVQTDNAEDTLTSEGLGEIGGTEVIENTDVHCDFDQALSEYKAENNLTELDEENQYYFFSTLITQGINPNTFECDNEYYPLFKAFYEKGNSPLEQEPTLSNQPTGGAITLDNGEVVPAQYANGIYVPIEDLPQHINELCEAGTLDKVNEIIAAQEQGAEFSWSDVQSNRAQYNDEDFKWWVKERMIYTYEKRKVANEEARAAAKAWEETKKEYGWE